MIILKTSSDTIKNVVKYKKHALDKIPINLNKNDIILIAQTKTSITDNLPQIRYLMEFNKHYPDENNESDRIWGRHWDKIIEFNYCKALVHPFNIEEIQVSKLNYGQGGPFVYVDKEDELKLIELGYLETYTDEKTIYFEKGLDLIERAFRLRKENCLNDTEFEIIKSKIISFLN